MDKYTGKKSSIKKKENLLRLALVLHKTLFAKGVLVVYYSVKELSGIPVVAF